MHPRTTHILEEAKAAAVPLATADDPLWYKDAVIYQTHIKAFFDANNDGSATSRG